MKSKMSFFDPTLLKKNISRFSPAWAILLLAMLLAFPMSLMRSLRNLQLIYENDILQHLRACESGGVVFALFAALIFAALVFKYLHTARAAYMMHAFPMTRRCMFLTNLVSGLLFYLVPALLTALCCLGVLWGRGISGFDGPVWSMFLRWTLQYLFFYGLAVFTMHISGRTVIAVLSYGALNFVFLLIPVLVLMLVGLYFKGFDYVLSEGILRLAPISAMLYDPENLAQLAVYGAIGLGLLALAWVHYRVRQVERAGDAMVYPWARIAFRLVFTLCCALGLGWVLAAFFNLVTSGSTAFLPYALLGCFLGWFGSSMMLERTVKVFRNKKVWLGFAAFAGVLILAVACLKYDVLGLQRRVPDVEEVESVELWTNDGAVSDRITLTAAADVATVRAAQEKAMKYDRRDFDINDLFDSYGYCTIHIRYHLAGGGTLQRAYELNLNDDYTALAALFARPEIAEAWYDQVLPQRFRTVTLEGTIVRDDDETGIYENAYEELECRDPAALREAVLSDAAAGRLPIVNFLTLNSEWYEGKWNSAQGYYLSTDLHLWFRIDAEGGGWTYLTVPILETAAETVKLFAR